jgi:hypothetical protein
MNNVDENEIIEDVNMNIENNSIQKPTYYDSKINELDQRYNLIMNELSNNYNNGNNENIKTDEKNIEKLQNDFFLLKNDLLNNIGTVSDNVTRYDLEINKVVTQNKKLKKSYVEMKQKNSGSKGFARDTQVLYNQYLMGNFLIGLVAISSVLLYQKYYTTTE